MRHQDTTLGQEREGFISWDFRKRGVQREISFQVVEYEVEELFLDF